MNYKLILKQGQKDSVKQLLSSKGFTFSSHQHAFWRASKNGLSIIFYEKGTLLFQGSESSVKESLAWFPGAEENTANPSVSILGLDESGKGDYFGPLVLAGAIVTPENFQQIKDLGVVDSKKLSDSQIQKIFNGLKDKILFKVRIILPEDYNPLYARLTNLNLLMVSEYKNLIARFDLDSYDKIILDKFSQSESQNKEIRKASPKEMLIIEKGEANLSVAAASIIARFYFIQWFPEIEKSKRLSLPKGSGRESGELFSRLKTSLKPEEFQAIAKSHFKESFKNELF
jgi:ribonuclease HIII